MKPAAPRAVRAPIACAVFKFVFGNHIFENSPAMGIFVKTSTDVRIERVAVIIDSQSEWVREHITVDIWALNTDGA